MGLTSGHLRQQRIAQTDYSTCSDYLNNTYLIFEQGNKCNSTNHGGEPFKSGLKPFRPQYMVGKKYRQIKNNAHHRSSDTG